MALFLALVIGCWIGRFRFGSFQLGGVAGSLLAAVLISQVGVHIDSGIKSVLFALFIYAVGYQSGPQFFRSLGRQSLKEILMAVVLAITGLITVVAVARIFHLDKGLAAGLAAGGLPSRPLLVRQARPWKNWSAACAGPAASGQCRCWLCRNVYLWLHWANSSVC